MTRTDSNPPGAPGAEVTTHPAGARPNDPLLEEINVLKLEGRYFCFDLREVPKRKGTLEYRDGDRSVKIELHPDCGQPSVLAYRILQAIFRKITLEGRPFPDTVAFSYRELGKLVGRDIFGGKDTRDLLNAIRQLEDTKVTLFICNGDKKESSWVRFSLIVTSGFIADGDHARPSRIKSAVLTLHPAIIDSMRRGHFAVFNWDRLVSLAPLSAALYKRLYMHLSNLFETKHNRTTLKFEKDYADICGEWLGGLQPFAYKSRIEQQLKPHLDALRHAGLIRSWTVEKKADGKSYKLVFTPGAGFFADYDLFYHGSAARVTQLQRIADEAKIQAPIELTRYFYRRLHKVEKLESDIFSQNDVAFAERVLARYGMDEGRALVDFTLASAASTKFAIKNIKAIETCLPAWEANRETRATNIVREKARALQDRGEKLRTNYHSFLRKHAFDHIQAMPPEDRASLRQQAEENVIAKYGKHAPGFAMSVTFEEQKLTLDRFPVPAFEAWEKSLR